MIARHIALPVSLSAAVSLAIGAACASQSTKPDAMSAADHRARAAEEVAAADEHDAKYDEDATAVRTRRTGAETVTESYNPTHWQHDAADAHRRSADRHLAAARSLEDWEDAACVDIPPAARGACPLLAPLSVEDLDDGVRVNFRTAEGATRAAQVIRCQQAYAQTRGFTDLPSCILYARGLEMEQDGNELVLRSKDATTRERLRGNVHAHQPPQE